MLVTRQPRRSRLSVGLAAALAALWLAAPASGACPNVIGDPAPGYSGSLQGIFCQYEGGAPESWTVPATVTEATFSVHGADDPGGVAGEERAPWGPLRLGRKRDSLPERGPHIGHLGLDNEGPCHLHGPTAEGDAPGRCTQATRRRQLRGGRGHPQARPARESWPGDRPVAKARNNAVAKRRGRPDRRPWRQRAQGTGSVSASRFLR